MEIQHLRKVAGVTWKDHLRNDDARKELSIPTKGGRNAVARTSRMNK